MKIVFLIVWFIDCCIVLMIVFCLFYCLVYSFIDCLIDFFIYCFIDYFIAFILIVLLIVDRQHKENYGSWSLFRNQFHRERKQGAWRTRVGNEKKDGHKGYMNKLRGAVSNNTREELYWPLHLLEAWAEYTY